jgi:hypothetical protein
MARAVLFRSLVVESQSTCPPDRRQWGAATVHVGLKQRSRVALHESVSQSVSGQGKAIQDPRVNASSRLVGHLQTSSI